MAIYFSLFEKSMSSTSLVHSSYLVLQVTYLNVFFFLMKLINIKAREKRKKRESEIEREREPEVEEEEEEIRGKYTKIWRSKCLR